MGEVRYSPKGDGRPRRGERYGLPVLEAEVSAANGWRARRTLRSAARRLVRMGVRRALAPPDFLGWEVLERAGLRPVDPLPFLRFHAGELALAALGRAGVPPSCGTVALRGRWADRDFLRAAEFLCPRVRGLVLSAGESGDELAAWLRRTYGVPVYPDGAEVSVAVRFDGTAQAGGGRVLSLYGDTPELAGVRLCANRLEEGDREDLPLLAALWETGKLARLGLEFT